MTNVRFTLKTLTLMAFMFAVASVANAQATRTWVSGVGDDVNPCSRTAPCKTFAGAISKTAVAGEIDALDPGGFGAVTTTKSITIDGSPTGTAGILAAGFNGVIVNDIAAASPNTAIVHIRGLSINGGGTGLDGIRFLAGKRLFVENCVIQGFKNGNATTNDGIDFSPTTAGLTFLLNVKNTVIKDNSGDGIRVNTASATINGSVDDCTISGNNNGLEVLGGTISITRSQLSGNTGSGLTVSNGALLNADDNEVTDNGTGMTNNASNFRISNNHVHRNTTGIGGAGTYQTFGDNKVIGNGTDVGVGPVFSNVTATNAK